MTARKRRSGYPFPLFLLGKKSPIKKSSTFIPHANTVLRYKMISWILTQNKSSQKNENIQKGNRSAY